ncbi:MULTISPECIES: asparagine--tRNA ligase [unclassified Dehalobacter]|uniref:asparagine--tRNA ligase n=1 Tax=unclassified Dehalobacter TaxID=2635733 RepID=UPI0003701FF1|nr:MULTISPECIES: asparagine--tRNA ligase [unclassified Dehalobacter]RJE47414.1 asparagine--tRNA ligase [Dehalobacter sp. MCB1]TCX48776.1 asparagine--tRNA ligase [Dehalobacter sp. 14DCB1]TCX56176.1 asparagine--tRNA ligase [Dehalobacter sp. 12DCB1]
MNSIAVKEIYDATESKIGERLQISGWVRTVRASKEFGFIEFNDGSCFRNLQIVYDLNLLNFSEVSRLGAGSALTAEGVLVFSPGINQAFELKAEKIQIENACPADYPLQKKKHSLEFLRTIAHLRPRTNTFSAVFRLRSVISMAVHQFFQDKGFIYVHTPIITGSDAEGAGEMFRVSTLKPDHLPRDHWGAVDYRQDFFGKETNLTVSGQLNAESFCLAFKDVYTFGPTFRAENSNTARHAAEFWMIEPEIAFAELNDIQNIAEEMMKYLITYALEQCPDEMEFFGKFIDKELLARLNNVLDSEFGHLSYSEAIEILKKANMDFAYPVEWGLDLQTEHERFLTEKVFGKPLFITDYPKEIKAFYMRQNDDQQTVAAMDLLVPGVGEIIGGSQREERTDLLTKRIAQLGMNAEHYGWYLELRKYGGVKHAGFGLGFERLIMYLSGISNIRDVIPFPRTVKSADF